MKAVVEKQDAHIAQINLEIPAEYATQEYSRTCKRFSQRLNIPGFRRGKAPRGIIEKTVGIDRLKQEALERLLPPAFADAISEHQLDTVAPPQVESVAFDLGSAITVKAKVELRPEVTLPGNLTELKAMVAELAVPEDAEEREIKALIERQTTLKSIIDRPAETTDIVNIDFAGTVNGETIKGGAAKSYRLDLSNSNFIEGFAAQIPGHKIGEEFTIKVTFPQDYHDVQLSGKPAEFVIKINEIKTKVVPDLTDELAKKIGPYETVDALKESIRKALLDAQGQEVDNRRQRAVIDVVVDASTVDIPQSMIDRESRLLLEEVKQRFKTQGISWEQFIEAQGQGQILQNLNEEAKKRIKTSLVFGAMAKAQSIAVSDDEFSTQLSELSTSRRVDDKQMMRQLANNPAAVQAFLDHLLGQKVVEFLLTQVQVSTVPESEIPAHIESETQNEDSPATITEEPLVAEKDAQKDSEYEVVSVD